MKVKLCTTKIYKRVDICVSSYPEANVTTSQLNASVNYSGSQYGPWADMHKCIYFSRNLSTQNIRGGSGTSKWNKAFKIPLTAFCEPKYVDPKTTEVYP